MANVDDAVRHLLSKSSLYWSVGFPIDKSQFKFPICGYMHISGDQVRYRATIDDIIAFSPNHFEDPTLAIRVKPEAWRKEWDANLNDTRSHPWRNVFDISEIVPYSADTYRFLKCDGTRVTHPPQSYVRVASPSDHGHELEQLTTISPVKRVKLHEKNIEDVLAQEVSSIEPGLRLKHRQLESPAGRLDLLCEGSNGDVVVVELKRSQGGDQVMGQILRYIGWAMQEFPGRHVRGIIIVETKDPWLTYASTAVPNVQVKQFKASVRLE